METQETELMKMEREEKNKGNGFALLPFAVFIVIYLGAGLVLNARGVPMAFYQFPSVTAMFLAVISAFAMTRGNFNERIHIFSRGASKEDVITMLLIYVLAGAFSSVSGAMGGRDATVNLGLSVIAPEFLTAGVFVISAFMGTATGTSMGTIGSIVPIAVGLADKGGLSVPLMVGACVGGAMFGDNLSMISDTTIAATRSQGCEMQDKFRVNFYIALPAAILTFFILLFLGRPESAVDMASLAVDPLKVLPYIAVLGMALLGMNVFLVLTCGIFLSGFIGMGTGSIDLFAFAQSIWKGFTSMNEVFFLTLFCAGMSELVMHNGGLTWLVRKLQALMRGPRSAQVGIAALVSLADCATANNTVAIVVVGNVAKEMSRTYRIDPRKTASLLDIFSCVVQGFLPYGAQILSATALVNAYFGNGAITSLDLIPYVWYCWLLCAFGLLSVFLPFAEGSIRKNPWDWDIKR